MANLEALEADTEAAAEIWGRLRELASIKGRLEGELEVAERGLAAQPDPAQARHLVDLLPLLDVDAALLAERSFGELLAALDFTASFVPGRKELRVGAVLAPELMPAGGDAMSALSSVHPTGQYAKKYPQVEGHVFSVSPRHAKQRREGYLPAGTR